MIDISRFVANLRSILNLHFVDGTLLFLKVNKDVLYHIKWLLIAFENTSGLKINYTKSEIYPLNLTISEEREMASVLGCQIKQLPSYLGVHIICKSLRESDW